MKKVLIIHGWSTKDEYYNPKYPTSSNSHWLPWVSKQLMIRDIHAITIEMPSSYYPEYEIWKKEFERFEIDNETSLIGHSCGGGFIVRWLSENPGVKVANVVLVAPWIGIRPDQPFDKRFFEFDINPNITSQSNKFVIYHSVDDVDVIQESVSMLREEIASVSYREFDSHGHFTLHGMGTVEFPELVDEVIT